MVDVVVTAVVPRAEAATGDGQDAAREDLEERPRLLLRTHLDGAANV